MRRWPHASFFEAEASSFTFRGEGTARSCDSAPEVPLGTSREPVAALSDFKDLRSKSSFGRSPFPPIPLPTWPTLCKRKAVASFYLRLQGAAAVGFFGSRDSRENALCVLVRVSARSAAGNPPHSAEASLAADGGNRKDHVAAGSLTQENDPPSGW